MKPLDRWVFGLLGLAVLGGLAARIPRGSENPVAEILRNGSVVERVVLDPAAPPREWVLAAPGGGFNRIRLEKGRIRMADANCPDRDCVHTGWLSRPGQGSVCLPHRVAIRILGTPPKGTPDALSQ